MIVSFIPARGGSRGVPRKNIKLLGGKPLLAYSIETSLKCGLRTIVSTEDAEISAVAKEYGVEVLDRPDKLAKDTTSMYEVLRSEIPKIQPCPDLVLLLHPTNPFRKSIHIKSALSYLTENLDRYDSLVSVVKIPSKWHPSGAIISTPSGKGMVMGKIVTLKEKVKSYFTGVKHTKPTLDGAPISQRITRRQDYPEAWVPTGSIYLFKTSNLMKGSMYGERVLLLETEDEININTEDDFLLATQQLQ